MSVGSAVFPIHRWLYGVLSGDAELSALVGDRIYENHAPGGADYPFVVFAPVSGPEDVTVIAGERLMARALYQVIVWVRGASLAPAEPILARIDALLHQAGGPVADGAVAGGVVLSSLREREIVAPLEIEGGTTYRGIGGEYRLLVQGKET